MVSDAVLLHEFPHHLQRVRACASKLRPANTRTRTPDVHAPQTHGLLRMPAPPCRPITRAVTNASAAVHAHFCYKHESPSRVVDELCASVDAIAICSREWYGWLVQTGAPTGKTL
jgi:hypothetical protein